MVISKKAMERHLETERKTEEYNLHRKLLKIISEERKESGKLAAALEDLVEVAQKNLGAEIAAVRNAIEVVNAYDKKVEKQFNQFLTNIYKDER